MIASSAFPSTRPFSTRSDSSALTRSAGPESGLSFSLTCSASCSWPIGPAQGTRPVSGGPLQLLHDLAHGLLCVSEEHRRLRAEVEVVVYAGEAGFHGTLDADVVLR